MLRSLLLISVYIFLGQEGSDIVILNYALLRLNVLSETPNVDTTFAQQC